MLSEMRYLSEREGFTNTKVHKRMQNKELFGDKKGLICPKTHKC